MSIDEIIAGMTEAQRAAMPNLSDTWSAGPTLPDSTCDQLAALREGELVERDFRDMDRELTASECGFRARLSACWWFRLTPLGLAVRARLEKQTND